MPFDASSLGSPRLELTGDVEIINQADGFQPAFARRGAVSRGKQRTTIEIQSEPLLHDFDSNVLGAEPAEAIRDSLSAAVKNITEPASPETLARRKRAQSVLEGHPSPQQLARSDSYRGAYMKRYSGGRTGLKMPNQTVRLFNDSERFAEGFFVRQNPEDATYTVNVPVNRLDPSEFRGDLFQRMLDKLRSLVPALQDSRALLVDPKVSGAISKSINDLITKGELGVDPSKLKALAAARKRLVKATVSALREIF